MVGTGSVNFAGLHKALCAFDRSVAPSRCWRCLWSMRDAWSR